MKIKTVIAATILVMTSCSKNRITTENTSEGGATIAISSPESGNSRATKATKMSIRVTNKAGVSLKDTTLSLAGELTLFSLPKLEQADGYSATAWTTDDAGDTIHAPQTKQFTVITNQETSIILSLTPICGSIVIQLIDIPTAIDSLFLTFTADSGTFATSAVRSPKCALSLDKVPYGARGTLNLKMIDKAKSTVASWDTLFTFTNQDISGSFSFLKTGNVVTEITMTSPSSAIFSGNGDPTKAIESESGTLVITEFCVTGGSGTSSGEFIEIHNPKTTSFSTDTMVISAADKQYKIPSVTIPAGGFYVVSGSLGAFWSPETVIPGLDMVGTSGVVSVSSKGVMHDYIIYFNDANAGWPALTSSAKKSWELKTDKVSANKNNLGSSWNISTTAKIDENATTWYGNTHSL